MSRKAFLVQVELDIQAVTCPGVWLCSNGKVSLQIYMLESCVQTASYKPNFPIQVCENFVFYKTFYSKHQLNELQKELHDQWLYIELVQWQNCEIGNVLASFQTTLDELLYPSTFNGSIAGVDLDLLMEPSKTFPGTIAPKVEVSTKTTIEETLCVCTKPTSSTVVVNPKVIMSNSTKQRGTVHRKVCHSVAYSKRRRPLKPKSKPPFCYRRAEDDLILRKPQYDLEGKYCSCRESKSLERRSVPNFRKLVKPELASKSNYCTCTEGKTFGHKETVCPLCSKYKGYFETPLLTCLPEPQKRDSMNQPRTSLFDTKKTGSRNPKNKKCQCVRATAFTTTDEDSADNTDPERKPSLAERLHAKLTKTLSSIPRSREWLCSDDNEYEYDCSDCTTSRAEIYRNLQKFYGDLYEKSCSNPICVPDCPRFK